VAVHASFEPFTRAQIQRERIDIAAFVETAIDGHGQFANGLRLGELVVRFGVGDLAAGANTNTRGSLAPSSL
jgi:hypothetical protein